MPPFRLAEWELPPELVGELEKPADARVWVKFAGVRQDVLLRKVIVRPYLSVLFARAELDEDGEENDDEANWVFAESDSEWAFPAIWPIFTASDKWSREIGNSAMGRVFSLEKSLAFLMSDGRGSWRALNGPDRNEAPFFWGDGRTDWKKRPAREWLEQLKIEIQNSGSDTRFALDFNFWEESKRQDFAVKCRHGSTQGLRETLRRIVLVMPALPDANRFIGSLTIHENLPVELSLAPAENQPFLREFMMNWENVLEAHFRPRCNHVRLDFHSAAHAYFRNSLFYMTFDCDSISHHDRIEAHKNLRDWARNHNIPFPEIKP